MWEKIGRYFGFGPELYEAEGWFSWQHLVFVSVFVILTILLAVILANKTKNKDRKSQIKVLKVAAIVMVTAELIKIILIEVRGIYYDNDYLRFVNVLPLFLCSILLISLPVAAFAKGRVQEAALDFTMIFGYIACLAGTYLAGNIFSSPILSFHVNVSTFTHCISGFSAIYITITKLAKMEKRNIWIVALILLTFEALALTVDLIQDSTPYESNFMFLLRDSGTPFSILTAASGGIQPVYTVLVMLIYFAYAAIFYGVYYLIKFIAKKTDKRNNPNYRFEKYKVDLPYEYPENVHEHMIDPEQTHKNDLDSKYPYYNTSKWYKFKRVMMHIFIQTIGKVIIWFRYKPVIYDKENYTKHKKELKNGFVSVSNHVYEWDFLTLRYALWERKGFILLWHNNHNRKIGNMIHNFGSIPIPRNDVSASLKMFRDIKTMLDDNQWLHVYAEESMWYFYQTLREFRDGAFYIACVNDKPILPMAFSFRPAKGLCKLWKGKYPNVNVSFGEPLYPNKDLPMNERIKDLLNRTFEQVKYQMDKYTPEVAVRIEKNENK